MGSGRSENYMWGIVAVCGENMRRGRFENRMWERGEGVDRLTRFRVLPTLPSPPPPKV